MKISDQEAFSRLILVGTRTTIAVQVLVFVNNIQGMEDREGVEDVFFPIYVYIAICLIFSLALFFLMLAQLVTCCCEIMGLKCIKDGAEGKIFFNFLIELPIISWIFYHVVGISCLSLFLVISLDKHIRSNGEENLTAVNIFCIIFILLCIFSPLVSHLSKKPIM